MSTLSYLQTAKIDEVFDCKSGLVVKADEVIKTEDDAILLRTRLMEGLEKGAPLYLCPACFKPVYLRSNIHKTGQSFVHRDVEGNCPKLQEKGVSEEQIRAIKFQGAKESPAHKETKQILVQCLNLDPCFSNVLEEKNWMSSDQNGGFRRPDVQAVFHHQGDVIPVVFEIQLSSTFLSEIVQRREFYRREGALLVWVFRNFVKRDPKLTQLDIFYPNNLNAFIINDRTKEKSELEGKLFLDCYWAEPQLRDGVVAKSYKNQMVSFDALTCDLDQQQAYWHDYWGAEKELFEEQKRAELKSIINRFRRYCRRVEWNERDGELSALRTEFDRFGYTIPASATPLLRLLKALYSLEAGKAIGTGFDNLIQYANNLYAHSPQDLLYFFAASNVYQRREVLEGQGDFGKWKAKKQMVWDELRRGGGSRFQWRTEFAPIVFLLLPEIKDEFDRLLAMLG